MKPFLQLAEDVGEVGDGALFGLENVHALDPVPELPFFFEVEPVPRVVAFDQRPEEREEKLQVFFGAAEARTG